MQRDRPRPAGRGPASAFVAEAAAVAKRDVPAGTRLDGEGGSTVFGALVAAERAIADRLLPIGLSDGLTLRHAVRRGQPIGLDDVEPLAPSRALEPGWG